MQTCRATFSKKLDGVARMGYATDYRIRQRD